MAQHDKQPVIPMEKQVEEMFRQLDKSGLTPAQRERLCADVYEFVLRWIEREDLQHEA